LQKRRISAQNHFPAKMAWVKIPKGWEMFLKGSERRMDDEKTARWNSMVMAARHSGDDYRSPFPDRFSQPRCGGIIGHIGFGGAIW
jgi:hypothetical protein